MDRLSILTAICELIEDDKFPARRNITDYFLLYVQKFDPIFYTVAENFVKEFYRESDAKKNHSDVR